MITAIKEKAAHVHTVREYDAWYGIVYLVETRLLMGVIFHEGEVTRAASILFEDAMRPWRLHKLDFRLLEDALPRYDEMFLDAVWAEDDWLYVLYACGGTGLLAVKNREVEMDWVTERVELDEYDGWLSLCDASFGQRFMHERILCPIHSNSDAFKYCVPSQVYCHLCTGVPAMKLLSEDEEWLCCRCGLRVPLLPAGAALKRSR